MRRLQKRDVKSDIIVHQCRSTNIFTLEVKEKDLKKCGEFDSFYLIKPARFYTDENGCSNVKTETYLESTGSNECQPFCNNLSIDGDTDDYIYMGMQQWVVYKIGDERHTFRKEIHFLMGESFELAMKKSSLKNIKSNIDESNPNVLDYKIKNKKIHRDFINDKVNFF